MSNVCLFNIRSALIHKYSEKWWVWWILYKSSNFTMSDLLLLLLLSLKCSLCSLYIISPYIMIYSYTCLFTCWHKHPRTILMSQQSDPPFYACCTCSNYRCWFSFHRSCLHICTYTSARETWAYLIIHATSETPSTPSISSSKTSGLTLLCNFLSTREHDCSLSHTCHNGCNNLHF